MRSQSKIAPFESALPLKVAATLACLVACSSGDFANGGEEQGPSGGGAEISEVEMGPGAEGEGSDLGSTEQALSYFDYFNFESSCSDPDGTNSVMAALAVATAVELKRWQPISDFGPDFGY